MWEKEPNKEEETMPVGFEAFGRWTEILIYQSSSGLMRSAAILQAKSCVPATQRQKRESGSSLCFT